MGVTEAGELVERFRHDPRAGWSMGTIGAIAEFTRDPAEAVSTTADTVVTGRGGIRVRVPDRARAVAYETPAGPHGHWNHAVALCLPGAAARRASRRVVTELGPDSEALRPEDRDGVLFDLGLGTPTVDACVRTADPELLSRLRAAVGTGLFSPGSAVAAAVVAAGPHRVFTTAYGRAEVYAAIPAPDGRSPDGPHTHLLPRLLTSGRTHAATVPIPAGHLPCAHIYPPHPLTDLAGRRHPFDHDRHRAFQDLLSGYGDPRQIRIKAAAIADVRAGRALPAGSDPVERAAVAVALRQLGHLDGPSAELSRARSREHTPTELLDPHGDPNGG